mgnify:CR=1 FL=1
MMQHQLSFGEAAEIYTLLAIGDGAGKKRRGCPLAVERERHRLHLNDRCANAGASRKYSVSGRTKARGSSS